MYILQLDYKIALDGGYGRKGPMIFNPFDSYFAERGAIITHNFYRDCNLVLGNDHVVNIIKIIDSVKQKGCDRLELTLTPDAYNVIKDRFWEISSLPKISARLLKAKTGDMIVRVIFQGKFGSLMEAELAYMSHEELLEMLDEFKSNLHLDMECPMARENIDEHKASEEDSQKHKEELEKVLKELAARIPLHDGKTHEDE